MKTVHILSYYIHTIFILFYPMLYIPHCSYLFESQVKEFLIFIYGFLQRSFSNLLRVHKKKLIKRVYTNWAFKLKVPLFFLQFPFLLLPGCCNFNNEKLSAHKMKSRQR